MNDSQRISQLLEENAELQSKLLANEKTTMELTKQVEKLISENEKQIEELTTELEEAQKKNAEFFSLIQKADNALLEFEEKEAQWNRERDALGSTSFSEEKNQLLSQILELQEKVSRLQRQEQAVSNGLTEAYEKEISHLKSRLIRYEGKDIRHASIFASSPMDTKTLAVDTLRIEVFDLKNQIHQYQFENKLLEEKYMQAQSEVKKLQTLLDEERHNRELMMGQIQCSK